MAKSKRNEALYWAAEPLSYDVATRALDKFAAGLSRARQTQQFDVSRRMLMTYYGWGDAGRDTSRVQLGGEQGELAMFVHNTLRPRVAQQLALIAGQRPGIKPVATNTDSASTAQTILADGLRQYYERTLAIPAIETDAVRGGLLAQQHWAVTSWRRAKGQPLAVGEDGRIEYEGGPEVDSVPWWRCIADPLARTPSQRAWVIWRKPGNRFALAAEYPQAAEYLKNSTGSDIRAAYDWGTQLGQDALTDFVNFDVLLGDALDTEEGVWVWEVRHVPTPALPNGRLVRFVSPDCVLFDSAAFSQQAQAPSEESQANYDSGNQPADVRDVGYPYDDLEAFDYVPERVVGTNNGHSGLRDVLGIQQLYDVCTTTAATTVNLFGRPHLWAGPEGAKGINAQAMSTGPVILETPTKPEVVKFEALSSDISKVGEWARGMADEAGGLNETVMGNPPAGMPAKAQALQRAQAVQVHQSANAEYMRLVENIATSVLRVAKRFARAQQTAEIAGKSGAWELRQWKREDIAGVRRFACEVVDPLTQSFEGRQAQAEFLAEKGWVSREGYFALMATGSMREPLESDNARLELIAQHKELLRQGIGLPPVDLAATQQAQMLDPNAAPVFVADGRPAVRLAKMDPHWLAIPEYYAVLLSPAARENPAIVEAVTGVVQESLRLWASMTADELAAMRGVPLPSSVGMGMPPGPMEDPAKGKGEATPPSKLEAKRDESLPKPPTNPLNNNTEGTEALALPAQPMPTA